MGKKCTLAYLFLTPNIQIWIPSILEISYFLQSCDLFRWIKTDHPTCL